MRSLFKPSWARAKQLIRSGLVAPLRSRSAPSGQGMTEYIVVVAVVAVAAIGVYSMLGQTIRNQTAGIAQEISGNDAGAALNAATTSAASARSQANTRKDLKNYNQDNH
jgi:Flp pilus assembly pilin Flp